MNGILLYILIAAGGAVILGLIMGKIFRGAIAQRQAQTKGNVSSTRSAPLGKQRIAQMLLIVGLIAIFYGVSLRPPSKDKLIPVTAQVTKVVTVSERLKNNESSAPSSVNPFEPHDWIELTVTPLNIASQDNDHVWKVNTALSDNDLVALHGARITALVKDLKYRSEAFEIKKDSGESAATYENTTAAGKQASLLFTILGAVSCITALVLFAMGQRKLQTA